MILTFSSARRSIFIRDWHHAKLGTADLLPTNTKFLTIGSLERQLLKDKNVKYSEIVETSMIPKFMAQDDSMNIVIKNHLQEEMDPKKLPNEFRKLHNDGSGNGVYTG